MTRKNTSPEQETRPGKTVSDQSPINTHARRHPFVWGGPGREPAGRRFVSPIERSRGGRLENRRNENPLLDGPSNWPAG